MKVVFFGTELNALYPGVIGCFLREDAEQSWVDLEDVLEPLYRGESVAIRPATDDEMANAEANAVLFDIGHQLGQAYIRLLNVRGHDGALSSMANTIATLDLIHAADSSTTEKGEI